MIEFLYVLAIVATLLDFGLTYWGLHLKIGTEANSVTKWFMRKLGWRWGLVAKAVGLDMSIIVITALMPIPPATKGLILMLAIVQNARGAWSWVDNLKRYYE